MPVARLMLVLGLGLAACGRPGALSAPLPQVQVTDPRYGGLVFLVATVQKAGADFVITNTSTQPWFDVTLELSSDRADHYQVHIDEVGAGHSVTADPAQFTTDAGLSFNPQRLMPRTLIISAEIGEGGPTGVYAVRL